MKRIIRFAHTTQGMAAPRGFVLQTPEGGNPNFIPVSTGASLRSGGYVFGNGDRFRLMISHPPQPVRVVEREWIAVPVGRTEAANWQEYADYFGEKNSRAFHYVIPKVKKVFRDIVTDNDSRIRVSVYATAKKIVLPERAKPSPEAQMYWEQATTYEVYSDLGEYLGRVELPMRSQLMAAQGDHIWVLRRGADNEDIIDLYTMSGVK